MRNNRQPIIRRPGIMTATSLWPRLKLKTNLILLNTLVISVLLTNSGCSTLLLITSANQLTDQDHGKRTLGARIEDQSIENKAFINLYNSDKSFRGNRIAIRSHNGYVLLTGQVKTADLKKKSTSITRDIRHVRRVYNEIEITKSNPISHYINDLWLTGKVRTAMLFTPHFRSTRVKLTSQNGTVYLMGLLTKKQTQRAVDITKRIHGVKKIVKLVEEIKPTT